MSTAVYANLAIDLGNQAAVTHEGGVAYAVSDWTKLRRFLILGSEGGTFYVGERELAREHAAVVTRCLDEDALRTVNEIVAVSASGRAPKNEPALFALALAASHSNPRARADALLVLDKVARTGTHLFHFAAYVSAMRGWGRGLRAAVGQWYQEKPLDDLAYQAIKYRQRDGWSHADLLRLAHPKPKDDARSALYKWIVDGDVPEGAALPTQIAAYETLAQIAAEGGHPAEKLRLIRDHRLPREAVPTAWLADPVVWEALLPAMPLTALIRNLGTMTKVGLLTPGSSATEAVLAKLRDEGAIRGAKVHPLTILLALTTYASGHGFRSDATWKPAPKIVDALDEAFYAAFANVVPTGKRLLLALDVSGSMTGQQIAGTNLSCAQAAAAMALITARTEPNAEIIAYDTSVHAVAISPRQRLDDVTRALAIHGGGTYCWLPFEWAVQHKFPADAIISYTDSETHDRPAYGGWYGEKRLSGSVWETLRQARRTLNPAMQGIVVGMAANGIDLFPEDAPGTLGVVGFDAAVPEVLADFLRGGLD